MDTSFVLALLALKNTNPDEFIKKLFTTLHSISTMNADEIVAAHQTLGIALSALQQPSDVVTEGLRAAIENQMVHLASQEDGLRYAKRFANVTYLTTTFSVEELRRR